MIGEVHLSVTGGVASVVFDRPVAHNAMTWAMYERLGAICDVIAADHGIRVAVLRGAGGKAFVAGTDIAQFQAFEGAEDGISYEAEIEALVGKVERLPVPTIALVEGAAMGGGLILAAACDLRLATPDARFGAPIARTLGNCLSLANLARLQAAFGTGRTQRMLLLAASLGADEALACGFLTEVVAAEAIDEQLRGLCDKLLHHAPITMRVSKEALRRILHSADDGDADLIRQAYGSEDFREGVAAFVEKRQPHWQGR